MAALVKRGGIVALHEADWSAYVCDPHSEAKGINLYVARRIPRMLRNAGLVDVKVHPLIHLYEPGHSRLPIFLQFVNNLRERIVAAGMISEQEFA